MIVGNNTIAGGSLWTPKRRGAQLAAWHRADKKLLNAGLVERLYDLSGNGRDMAQSTAAQRFAWTASDSEFNNAPVCTFDGNDWLDAIAAWNLSQPLTVYWVGKVGNVPSVPSGEYGTPLDAVAGARIIVRANAAELLSFYGGSANVEPGASVAGPSIVCVVFNGASSSGYVNNVTASVSGNPGSGGLGTPRYGATPTGTYPLPTGSKFREAVFVTNADNDAQRRQMFRYLRRSSGVAITGL